MPEGHDVHDDAPDEAVQSWGWRSAIVSHAWAGSALPFTTASGDVWYANAATGETSWTAPGAA